jgi:hypothetical protein
MAAAFAGTGRQLKTLIDRADFDLHGGVPYRDETRGDRVADRGTDRGWAFNPRGRQRAPSGKTSDCQ